MTDAQVIDDDRIIKRLVVEHEKDGTGQGYIEFSFSPI